MLKDYRDYQKEFVELMTGAQKLDDNLQKIKENIPYSEKRKLAERFSDQYGYWFVHTCNFIHRVNPALFHQFEYLVLGDVKPKNVWDNDSNFQQQYRILGCLEPSLKNRVERSEIHELDIRKMSEDERLKYENGIYKRIIADYIYENKRHLNMNEKEWRIVLKHMSKDPDSEDDLDMIINRHINRK